MIKKTMMKNMHEYKARIEETLQRKLTPWEELSYINGYLDALEDDND